MSQNTGIEWTEATWNPLTGCKEISPGCTNCYAAVMARRLAAMGQRKYAGTTKQLPNGKTVWTGKINLDPASLQIPLQRKKPTMYFVNSMSDLFHDDVPDEFIWQVFRTMRLASQHTFQVLTKRAERMQSMLRERTNEHAIRTLEEPGFNIHWPLPNVWLGVSVEDQARADARIPLLLQTPAAVRFLSLEPLLGPVQLWRHREPCCECGYEAKFCKLCGLDWVIVGGESGAGARPCEVGWIRSVVAQCRAAVPVFVKQLGSNAHDTTKNVGLAPGVASAKFNVRWKLKHSKGADMKEWPEDLQVREHPAKATVPA